MLTVYYSPHSQSVDNEAGRASGHADVGLTVQGRREAQQLGEHYASYPLDAVFCSDLQRASTTAEIAFSDRHIPIIPDARLREFDYGKLTQHPRTELALETHITEPFPDGESILMAVERVGDFLREVLRDYDGKTIVVIGHVATKYGLTYWSDNVTLKEIVEMDWEWRDVPIWRFQFDRSIYTRQPS